MAYINTEVLDAGLDYLNANANRLDICYTQEPTDRTEAITTYSCGSKSTPTVGVPVASGSGRKVIISAISDGNVSATQTAGWWALTSATELLAAGPLTTTQLVTDTNTFTLDAIEITFPAATAV